MIRSSTECLFGASSAGKSDSGGRPTSAEWSGDSPWAACSDAGGRTGRLADGRLRGGAKLAGSSCCPGWRRGSGGAGPAGPRDQPGVSRATVSLRSVRTVYSKYVAGYEGSYGDVKAYHAGLDGFLGAGVDGGSLIAAMQGEHCTRPSGFGASASVFESGNYGGIRTTPSAEWQHVFDPDNAPDCSAGKDLATGDDLGLRERVPWSKSGLLTQGVPGVLQDPFAPRPCPR
jgi:hypothetical protein